MKEKARRSIINLKELIYMSAIIGICGENYCLFVADRRRVGFNEDGTLYVLNDSTSKIFRANDRLLFGCTGIYEESERTNSLLRFADNMRELRVEDGTDLAAKYIDAKKKDNFPIGMRTYIFGGKNRDGQFCMITNKYNPSDRTLERTEFNPPLAGGNVATVILLPHDIRKCESYYNDLLEEKLKACASIDAVKSAARNVIREIAEDSDTVSYATENLIIFGS